MSAAPGRTYLSARHYSTECWVIETACLVCVPAGAGARNLIARYTFIEVPSGEVRLRLMVRRPPQPHRCAHTFIRSSGEKNELDRISVRKFFAFIPWTPRWEPLAERNRERYKTCDPSRAAAQGQTRLLLLSGGFPPGVGGSRADRRVLLFRNTVSRLGVEL
jgi:hypothetical protein